MILRKRTTSNIETPGTPPDGVADAITAMMRRGHVPGLSIAVVDRDRLLFAGGYGLADQAANQPATARTAYLWFSMTKIVTASAALRLAGEGRLDLDAPVGEYLRYVRAPGTAQPSVRQLLSHTAGLSNPLPIRWVHPADSDLPDPEALLRRLMSRRRAYRHPVGATARYSNVGYLAVGQIIAVAAGMPFEDYVDRAVLRPLGMSETGFGYPVGAEAATGYVKAPTVVDPLLRRMLPPGVVGHRHGPYLALNRFYDAPMGCQAAWSHSR
jgi:CubicO group peptidase (beta-lactamase class C family)